jgi:hypothetical protein
VSGVQGVPVGFLCAVFFLGVTFGLLASYVFAAVYFSRPVHARQLLRGMLEHPAAGRIVGCLVCGERGKLVVLEETALPPELR